MVGVRSGKIEPMGKHKLGPMDHVWNRACDFFSEAPLKAGDHALRDLLRAHGMICNGGVFNVFDTLTAEQIEAAKSGYRFFGLDQVTELLSRARKLLDKGDDVGECEQDWDAEYAGFADDPILLERFKRHFNAHPSDFAPLEPDGGNCE
jgi:hypothetical protein